MAFRRVLQKIREVAGTVEKTDIDKDLEGQMHYAEATEDQVKKVIDRIEGIMTRTSGLSKLELLSQCFNTAAAKVGQKSALGTFLAKLGDAEHKLGMEERAYVRHVDTHVLKPLKQFVDGEMKEFHVANESLIARRLDMDATRNQLRKDIGSSNEKLQQQHQQNKDAFVTSTEYMKALLHKNLDQQEVLCEVLREFCKAQLSYHHTVVETMNACLASL